jgi:hypothetical protein
MGWAKAEVRGPMQSMQIKLRISGINVGIKEIRLFIKIIPFLYLSQRSQRTQK